MSLNRVIGAQGKIPWHLSQDLKFFKRTTVGHVILMGRKTYESLGKPLPGRENWVVTSRSIPGVRVIHDLSEIAEPGGGREIFLIGGAQLYAALLGKCAVLFLTLVKREVTGDAFFPRFEDAFRPGGSPFLVRRDGNSQIRAHIDIEVDSPPAPGAS